MYQRVDDVKMIIKGFPIETKDAHQFAYGYFEKGLFLHSLLQRRQKPVL